MVVSSGFKLMQVISNLSDEQKKIVKEINFSSILHLSCSSVPRNLFLWLAEHFETASNTVNLPHGFSFSLNSSVVHKVLGIPHTSRQIQCSTTEDSYQFMKSQFKSDGRTPSVDELVAIISPDISGDHFARAFMLLVLSSFLCPNKRNMASSKYYSSLVSVPEIKEFDWCSLVLQWLTSSIRKFQNCKSLGQSIPTGGCAFLLVVNETLYLYTLISDINRIFFSCLIYFSHHNQ